MDPTECAHCGHRIVWVNWALRPSWTHQPAGAAFHDGMHVACHITVATAPIETVTGDYWHGPDRTEPTEEKK